MTRWTEADVLKARQRVRQAKNKAASKPRREPKIKPMRALCLQTQLQKARPAPFGDTIEKWDHRFTWTGWIYQCRCGLAVGETTLRILGKI